MPAPCCLSTLPATAASDAPHHVTVEDTGETFPCTSQETALSALARSGRRGIPLGCRGGGCGVCKVAVIEGDYVKRVMSRGHVSEEDEQAHRVLACCIQPGSDLRLRVLGRMRKAVMQNAGSPSPVNPR